MVPRSGLQQTTMLFVLVFPFLLFAQQSLPASQPVCGDGSVAPPELCDDGNTQSGDGCRSDCSKVERCGDGVHDVGEGCDDGNLRSNDGCSSSCFPEQRFCGDGVLDKGEVCDDGNSTSNDGCREDCLGVELCGDGLQDSPEECDDGNNISGDGCHADCSREHFCGNSVIDVGEVCDDGNSASGDGCRADCLGVELCGDGFVDPYENCDDGNTNDDDECPPSCFKNVDEAILLSFAQRSLAIAGIAGGIFLLFESERLGSVLPNTLWIGGLALVVAPNAGLLYLNTQKARRRAYLGSLLRFGVLTAMVRSQELRRESFDLFFGSELGGIATAATLLVSPSVHVSRMASKSIKRAEKQRSSALSVSPLLIPSNGREPGASFGLSLTLRFP